jgi:hypothetical protein
MSALKKWSSKKERGCVVAPILYSAQHDCAIPGGSGTGSCGAVRDGRCGTGGAGREPAVRRFIHKIISRRPAAGAGGAPWLGGGSVNAPYSSSS